MIKLPFKKNDKIYSISRPGEKISRKEETKDEPVQVIFLQFYVLAYVLSRRKINLFLL